MDLKVCPPVCCGYKFPLGVSGKAIDGITDLYSVI